MQKDYSKLKRPRYVMPEYIKKALEDNYLMDDYLNRPPYQQNDYLGWIEHAKQTKTRKKRLEQMLNELKAGGIYMKMKHPASGKSACQD
jgi:uncharacterized protein YdeI (YjbR/CyaY-like superfamily)